MGTIPAILATLAFFAGGLLLLAALRRIARLRRERARAAERAAEIERSAPRIAERLAAIRPSARAASLSLHPAAPAAPRAARGQALLASPSPPAARPAGPRASAAPPPPRPSARALVAGAGVCALVLVIAVLVLVEVGGARVTSGGVLGVVGAPAGARQGFAARSVASPVAASARSAAPRSPAPGSAAPRSPAPASAAPGFAAPLAGMPGSDGTVAVSPLPAREVSSQAPGQAVGPVATGAQARSAAIGICGPFGCQTYTVRPGDTIGRIAQRFGLTIQAVLAANPQVTNPNLIVTHQVLLIPRS